MRDPTLAGVLTCHHSGVRKWTAGGEAMAKIDVRVLREIPEGVEVGSEPCACGGCRPTATAYRDDPSYQHHDPELAQGPCCCGRFFVIGPDAEERARRMATEREGPDAYVFERKELPLPWGEPTHVVVADIRA